MEIHIQEKRNELIWALNAQGYTDAQIGRMFNLHRASVGRIVREKPQDWTVKWFKK